MSESYVRTDRLDSNVPQTEEIDLECYYDSDRGRLVVRHPQHLGETITSDRYCNLEDAR